ncbi:MAG: hypothetical protein FJ290_23360 [Planctomycetes bacterium]|nr:hypothetical protein [Planctomycetota bacterium]
MRPALPLLPALPFLLAGCTLFPRSLVPVHYYTIDPPAVEPRPDAAPADLVLAVHTLGAAPRYRERILFRKGPLAAGYHETSRWVEPPADMLSTILRRTLDARRIARVVADDRLLRRPDLILDGRLTRFDEVQADPAWRAECELELLLKQADDGAVLLSARFAASREAAARTTAAFAEAMNAAVANVVAQAADAIAKTLAALKKPDKTP